MRTNGGIRFFSLLCLRAQVVYLFQCQRDADLFYIGKTKRHLFTRMKEQLLSFQVSICTREERVDAQRLVNEQCDKWLAAEAGIPTSS